MSLTVPNTNDAPVPVAIMPDWVAGVRQQTIYQTDITRSRRGLEQRAQRRRRPALQMEYEATHADESARLLLEKTVQMNRTPVLVPWWPSAVQLSTDMASDTVASLILAPVWEDWSDGWCYLWHRAHGGEFRQYSGRVANNITLVDTGTHIRFPAGSYVWPVRLAVRQRDDLLLESSRQREAANRLIFRTL